MKEFDKRWAFRYNNPAINLSPEKEIGKYFWRAALEWVLEEVISKDLECDTENRDLIQEELKGR